MLEWFKQSLGRLLRHAGVSSPADMMDYVALKRDVEGTSVAMTMQPPSQLERGSVRFNAMIQWTWPEGARLSLKKQRAIAGPGEVILGDRRFDETFEIKAPDAQHAAVFAIFDRELRAGLSSIARELQRVDADAVFEIASGVVDARVTYGKRDVLRTHAVFEGLAPLFTRTDRAEAVELRLIRDFIAREEEIPGVQDLAMASLAAISPRSEALSSWFSRPMPPRVELLAALHGALDRERGWEVLHREARAVSMQDGHRAALAKRLAEEHARDVFLDETLPRSLRVEVARLHWLTRSAPLETIEWGIAHAEVLGGELLAVWIEQVMREFDLVAGRADPVLGAIEEALRAALPELSAAPSREMRRALVCFYERRAREGDEDAVIALLGEEADAVAVQAMEVLARIGGPASIRALNQIEASQQSSWAVSAALEARVAIQARRGMGEVGGLTLAGDGKEGGLTMTRAGQGRLSRSDD